MPSRPWNEPVPPCSARQSAARSIFDGRTIVSSLQDSWTLTISLDRDTWPGKNELTRVVISEGMTPVTLEPGPGFGVGRGFAIRGPFPVQAPDKAPETFTWSTRSE